ncbi:MAG: hypothetical protein IPP27_14520 [Bacteroidetes bacterium]|nr:hypothetical protein [Bacteroidota bacterium]
MKKLYLFGVLLLFTSVAFAQAPQGMNYQAVARNSAGNILANQAIGIRITITDGNAGPTLYQETPVILQTSLDCSLSALETELQ